MLLPPTPPALVDAVESAVVVSVVELASGESVLPLVAELAVTSLPFAPPLLGPLELCSVLGVVVVAVVSVGPPPAMVPSCATALPLPLSPQEVIVSSNPPINGIRGRSCGKGCVVDFAG